MNALRRWMPTEQLWMAGTGYKWPHHEIYHSIQPFMRRSIIWQDQVELASNLVSAPVCIFFLFLIVYGKSPQAEEMSMLIGSWNTLSRSTEQAIGQGNWNAQPFGAVCKLLAEIVKEALVDLHQHDPHIYLWRGIYLYSLCHKPPYIPCYYTYSVFADLYFPQNNLFYVFLFKYLVSIGRECQAGTTRLSQQGAKL